MSVMSLFFLMGYLFCFVNIKKRILADIMSSGIKRHQTLEKHQRKGELD